MRDKYGRVFKNKQFYVVHGGYDFCLIILFDNCGDENAKDQIAGDEKARG